MRYERNTSAMIEAALIALVVSVVVFMIRYLPSWDTLQSLYQLCLQLYGCDTVDTTASYLLSYQVL